jgi:type I restriction enzyme M protein
MLEVVNLKISVENIKLLIKKLGYKPEDGTNGVYFKKYSNHNNYIIRINFVDEKIQYRSEDIEEVDGIRWGDTTTSNFENSENFVVFECVDRLLEKGYAPKNISLEHKYPLGRDLKGKLDILVLDGEQSAFMMIECKTWGLEFSKEQKKMIKDGGQLFSYYVQDKGVKYLCLYTSRFSDGKLEYENDVIKSDEAWLELNNKKEIHDHWNKNANDNGIFEDWARIYDIEIKALVKGRLKQLTKDDSGRIFNQFAEILRHNVVSDKPNAFNKILNLFICKIYDENKNEDQEVEFQWRDDDTDEDLQNRLNDLYKKGMLEFLDIDVTDYSENEISAMLRNIDDADVLKDIQNMFLKLRLQKNSEFAFIEVYNDQSFKSNARVVREVVELLQPYQFRYGHKQQFLGDFFELLLNTSIKQESGQFFTPVPITRFIISCLPIKEFIQTKIKSNETHVLPSAIDYATGSGHFLTEYMDQVQKIIEGIDVSKAKPSARKNIEIWGKYDQFGWAKDYVYGIEADYRLVKTTKVSSFLNGDGEANIIRANGLDHFIKSKDFRGKLKEVSKENQQDNEQFDILIANPPYSVTAFKSTVKYGEESFELYDRLTDSSSEIECLFIERTKQLLKVGGWAGVILPSSILSNTGIYTATREILLKNFYVKAITEFGPNTFMATGTNTVTLFLERRPNSDWYSIHNAINLFFDRHKDVTVLGIEKAFSKYVNEVFEDINLEDYISLLQEKPNEKIKSLEVYNDYITWFNNLTEIKNLKDKKAFKDLSLKEQQIKLYKIFFDKIFQIEKDKMLYFLLAYHQKIVIVKVGEKQAEKNFIGYEFSNRRGHEGIKMLPHGTKLYDEDNQLNFKKANSYIYKAFLNEEIFIDEAMRKNVSIADLIGMMNFDKVDFEKGISLNSKKKLVKWKYEKKKLGIICNIKIGGTPPRNNNEYYINAKHNWLSISEMNGNVIVDTKEKINDLAIKKSNVKLIKEGTTLISFKLSIGKTAIAGTDLYTNEAIAALEIADNYKSLVLDKYLFDLFTAKLIDLECSDFKAFGKSLNSTTLKEVDIPLPPLEIQQNIVLEIEEIENMEKSGIKKIEELTSYLLKPQYFEYSEQRIDRITTMVQRGKSAKYGRSKIQIIKSGQARGYEEFDFSQRHYVSENYVSDERNLVKGDLLINSSGVGTAGRVTLFNLDGDFVVDSHVTIVRFNKDIVNPKYALYAFANIGFKTIEKMATGQSGQIELALPIINNIRIPLPPIETQNRIVEEIETFESKITNLKAEISDTEEKKRAILMKYLK